MFFLLNRSAWSDVDSFTQISTHKTNTRKDSKTGEIVTHREDQRKKSRFINKKEKKDNVKRPSKGRRTSQDIENRSETPDNDNHVHVADAASWFQCEDTMLADDSEFELTDNKPVLKFHVQNEDERLPFPEVGTPSSFPKSEKRRTSKVPKRDSIKSELEDEFHVVMGDIRNEVIESEPPPMISVIEEKEEKEEQAEELFEEIQNPSKGSLFQMDWNFNEVCNQFL